MNRVKKLSITIIAALCSVLIILSAAVLVSPWLLDKTSLKSKVCSEVSRLIGGEFRYSTTALSLFPSPHFILVNPQIDIPETLSASVDTVEVYPELIKLFTGRFVLSKTTINRPKATVWIAESTAEPKKHSGPVEFSRLVPTLLHSLSRLPKPVYAIDNGIVSNGSVSLIYNKTTTVTFDSIDAEIENRSDTLSFNTTSSSNMFDSLLVKGTVQNGTRNGNAHIELDKLKLDAVSDGFFSKNPVKIVAGEATVGIDITVHGDQDIDITLKGSAPDIHVEKAKQNVALDIQTIAARININSASTAIALSELTIGKPSMRLSGNFSLSDQSPKLKVQLQGHTIDINTVRLSSLVLAGSDSVTQTIFEIVKDGTIPQLTISSQADTMDDLADLDNLVLQTSLANGTIDVPGTRLELTDVSGSVTITKGVLAAEHVLAQRQKSTVKDGIVKIDLNKDPLPLDISADLQVDVAEIPAILKDVTDDQRINDELEKVKDLDGSAKASLTLSGSTDDLEIKVSASDIKAAARYTTLPFPLKIDSGGLTYGPAGITWNKLNGSVGSSSFSSFSGSLDFAKTKTFEITSGSSDIFLEELLPWINQRQKKTEVDGKGQIHLNLKNPKETSLVGKLSGKNFSLPTSLKTPVLVKDISLNGTTETITLESVDLSWDDTELKMSGGITPNFPEKPRINLDVEAGSIDVDNLLSKIKHVRNTESKEPIKTFSMPVQGTVHFKAKKLDIKDRTIQPFQADIHIQNEDVTITVKDTGLCGIITSGTITLTPDRIQFHLKPEAQKQQIGAMLDCITDKEYKADGTFDLKGRLEGNGTLDELVKSTSGSFHISTSDGHLYRDIVLLNVLKFLNTAEVLTHRLSPDEMRKKGIGFDQFELDLKLQGAKLEYESFTFDGDEIKLSGTGEVDLLNKQLDFTLLVTTQKLASTLLGHIPLVGGVLQTIATIPLTVKGRFGDIHVLPLAPAAVGHELKELTEQTLGVPLNLVHLHDFHPTEIHD